MTRNLLAAFVVLGACAPSPAAPEPAPTAGSEATPGTIRIDGEPNGLVWDADRSSLLIADEAHDRIFRWREGTDVELVVELPAAERPGLGQPVLLPDGTIVVAQFHSGIVFRIAPGASPVAIPDLDPTRRRLGLTLGPGGALYAAYFVHGEDHEHHGAISRIGIDGGELDVVADLRKPVGVVAGLEVLFFSDQERDEVLGVPLSDLTAPPEILAHVERPDLVTASADGSIFVTSEDGSVARIGPEGTTEVVASGLAAARGVALDETGHRLFVSEHGETAAERRIRVFVLR